MTEETEKLIAEKIDRLYGPKGPEALDKLRQLMDSYRSLRDIKRPAWTEKDVALITYADMVQSESSSPLCSLDHFLKAWLAGVVNTVHVLPFSPYSSDDGFSVVDFRTVNSKFGTWNDLANLGKSFHLMFDLVLNHVSAQSEWAKLYKAGHNRYRNYFIEVKPETDLSGVTRPRVLPLLTPLETSSGIKHIWTTFSEDQLDLNYANPDVLLEMIDILLMYIGMGMRIIRLDAIAYLWKRIGTSCIHLDETHLVVKIIRHVLEECAPGVILLTETNVPHDENISYLGNGHDEAHMVYQFTLPPLLLYSIIKEDATALTRWASNVEPPSAETTFFNFTASHDGIGVRPLEGIVPRKDILDLASRIRERGGFVSMRTDSDGNDSPYELNITYFSAMQEPDEDDPEQAIERFLASQSVMLALQGIPAIYFHSFFATPNALRLAETTGANRAINRRKYELDELHRELSEPKSAASKVYQALSHMVRTRTAQPCFHPNVKQTVLSLHPRIFAVRRGDILALTNFSAGPVTLDLSKIIRNDAFDVLAESSVNSSHVVLNGYQPRWIKGMLYASPEQDASD
ncbi:MAG: sugar phosphorylase [Verrucomicrobiota bacterium]